MPANLQVHRPVRNRDGNVVGLKATPYVRMSNGEEVIIVQDGAFYGGGGGELTGEPPEWVLDQLDAMNPVVLDELRMKPRKKSKLDPSLKA